MEWPLPLWQVLREELAELKETAVPPVLPDAREDGSRRPPAADANHYQFSSEDIVDISLLANRIVEREHELQKVCAAPEFAARIDAIKTIFPPVGPPAPWHEVAEVQAIAVLNQLLTTKNLYLAFANFPESQHVQDQNPDNLSDLDQVAEMNRDLLDRAFAGGVMPVGDKILPDVIGELHRAQLSALCFSGGGIRSATFCLGVLQGLADADVLPKFHYLSTVSGGGFLGGWLAAWTYWSKRGLPEVVEQLTTPQGSKLEPEADPVFYLRNFSNYLTPLTGLFSGDSWTLGAIYMRNLLLNWIVLLPLLIALLAVPRLILVLLHPVSEFVSRAAAGWLCLLLAAFGFACAMFYQGMARPGHVDQLEERSRLSPWARWFLRNRRRENFLRVCLMPLMLSAFIFATYIFHAHLFRPGSGWVLGKFIAFGAVSTFIGWMASAISLRKFYGWDLIAMLLSAVAGMVLFYLTVMVWPWFRSSVANRPDLYLCLAPPLVLMVFLLAATFFVGFATFWTNDEDREYWARMGAWILIACLAWTALGLISLRGPEALLNHGWWSRALKYGGAIVTIASTYLGWSSKTPARLDNESTPSSSALLPRGLPILGAISIVAILAVLAIAAGLLVDAMTYLVVHAGAILGLPHAGWIPLVSIASELKAYHGVSIAGALLAIVAATLLGLVMSVFIDPNKYSLHAMYRNRLIRAYLGASRKKGARHPNPFTGFDPGDNIPMKNLWREQPRKLMPVINMTLNMVEPVSKKLAWQERKAETFTVTPLHSGSFWVGYRRSSQYARYNYVPIRKRVRDDTVPITLGTATAISGAAVSPDMGYNSSSIVSLLLTLFNVRLGWWLGNPGAAGNDTYKYSNPGAGATYLLDEALGRTNDEKPHVYLSDGGHFENLGLYEMVLRRCHTILVIDADEDRDFAFENLGNAIRKIRTDLGISIEFAEFSNFRKRNDDGPTLYCAVGKIRYRPEDPCQPDGRLI